MYIEEENQKAMQSHNNQNGFELNQNIWNPQIEISNYAIEISKQEFYRTFLGALQDESLHFRVSAFKASNRAFYSIRKIFLHLITMFSHITKANERPVEQ
jgi:hypothetical protein